MDTAPGEWVIRRFDLDPGPKVGLRLRISGSAHYADVLRRAFPPPARWYGPYDSFDPKFDYVLYVQDADEAPLRRFLEFGSETLLVPIAALDECWAMAMHMREDLQRTGFGELVHQAKTYSGKPGDAVAANELATLLAGRMRNHPVITRADRILGVPANPPKAPHNLPELLADRVAQDVGRPYAPDLVQKMRPTTPLKDLPNEDKPPVLEGAYEVGEATDGETIVVVDDLLQSGTTLGHIANLLRQAGAAVVIGVAATKTLRSEHDASG